MATLSWHIFNISVSNNVKYILRVTSIQTRYARQLTLCPKLFVVKSPELLSEKKYEKPGIKIEKVVTADGVVEVKKKIFQPRVSLLGTDGNLQVCTIEEANKIAKRRNLKLFQVSSRDPKTDRAVYKLVNASELLEAKKIGNNPKTANKDDKLLTLSSKITEHDLQSKINQILKWLQKENTVRIAISGDITAAEKIFNTISEKTKNDGRIPQKVFKGGEIRFQILLPKKLKTPQSACETKPEEVG